MSGTNSNSPPGAGGGGDPSMEDILASIRRILAEDDPPPGAAEQDGGAPPAEGDEVLVLDSSMRKSGEPEPEQAPAEAGGKAAGAKVAPDKAEPAPVAAKPPPASAQPKQETKPAPAAPAAAAATVPPRKPVEQLAPGTSLEDAVRAAFEPAIKEWLDAALPRLVERMVRVEVERIVGGAIR